jgi:DNA (cytosine-5)-methyltransferase 1
MPTHGTGPGLHPPPTILGAISNIPFDALNHNPDKVHKLIKPPINPMTLSGTIKCSGNSEKVYHPSGLRYYTAREMASIQTFPMDYEFIGNQGSQSRQIGNAVPPLAAKAIFLEVRKSLQKADQEEIAGDGNSQ